MSGPLLQVIVLGPNVTVQDIARALEYTGLAVSNTLDPHVFVVKPVPRTLPLNVVPIARSMFHRPQAD